MNFNWIYEDKIGESPLKQLMKKREISKEYIAGDYDLPDSSLLNDIEFAADRIITALTTKEKIMIFGHDDLDGITSVFILFDFLSRMGSQNHYYYIPNRYYENHGIQNTFIDRVQELNCTLVITVDNGISSYDAVSVLNDNNVNVIITDHHLIPQKIPSAYAVVNPKQQDCKYPFKMLAGVGVSYLLTQKIAEKLEVELPDKYNFWLAIGTVADRVPLKGLNRYFVRDILLNWEKINDDTLNIIYELFWFPRDINSRMALIRQIIRILNNGRERDGKNSSLELMLTHVNDKMKLLRKLYDKMCIEDRNTNAVLEYVNEIIPEEKVDSFIFYDKDDKIPYNILGYMASLISQRILTPVIMLKPHNGSIVCEARCTEGFNLVESFNYCSEYLEQFGGHVKAAGFTIKKENVSGFKMKFHEYVEKNKMKIKSHRKIDIDIVLDYANPKDKNALIMTDFSGLQPFGQDNPEPIILVKNFSYQDDTFYIKLKTNKLKEGIYDIVIQGYSSPFAVVDYRRIS